MTVPRLLARLALIAVVGGLALGTSLALLGPAGRELASGATEYEPQLPELSTLAQRSYVYDRNGNLMAVLFAEEDRAPITLDEVPDHLVDAVLAIEDRNFYEHGGIDLKATVRALLRNVDEGQIREGGSTITQQLVKIGLIQSSERTVDRKIREAVLAIRLEQQLGKDEILERYLNQVYFGQGAYGVRAAAERYFDKQPSELEVHESALLAGLIANPEGANPITAPERAAVRRREVLDAMVETGTLDQDTADALALLPLPSPDTTFGVNKPRPDTFFVEEVKKQLLRDERLGETYQDRYQQVFRGGLRVYTTFDPRLQLLAEAAVRSTLPPDTEFTAALVALDNADGSVRALVGGTDFSEDQFDLATQSIRQTGSSFKAITLATALDRGYSPEDTVSGRSPCSFDLPGGAPTWTISSHGTGTITVREATVRSINCAYARIALSLGADSIVAMADRLGIDTSTMQAVPSITLGTQSTPVIDMAAAYSVFASEGIRHDPIYISRIESATGEVLFEADTSGARVLDENVARTETDVLRGVITGGTGTRARLADRPAAGKTGTTDDAVDALFVGYTPQITAAVWMGHPHSLVPMRNVGQFSTVFGGSYPALIWKAFMDPAHEGLEVLDFTPPDRDLWPVPRFITEDGRGYRAAAAPGPGGSGSATSTTSTSSTSTPEAPSTTTIPPTTSPPPPTTLPPTTAPTPTSSP